MDMLQQYRSAGYLVLRQFLPKADIQSLLEDAQNCFRVKLDQAHAETVDRPLDERIFHLFAQDFESFTSCAKQAQHILSLYRLGTDPRVVSLVRELGLQSPVFSVRPVILFNSRHLAKAEDYWRLGAHQDWRSTQGSLNAVTIWIALCDVDRALGALEVIPGSHQLGLMDSSNVSYYGKIAHEFPEDQWVPCEVEQGDAIVFSSFLVHRSGTNTTQRIRWSLQYRYNDLLEPTFVRRGLPNVYTYKAREDLLTPDFPSPEEVAAVFTA